MAEPRDKKILVIEPDAAQRKSIKELVAEEGFQVDDAWDMDSALRKIKASEPDLVVLDLMLQGRSGVELLRHLQSDGLGGFPAFLITDRVMDPVALQLMLQEPYVRKVMQKPVDSRSLAAALHEHLQTTPSAARAENPWKHAF
ncbi:MAG: response regulator transcription factor [Elusimicrobia bacterium]|nr:response regulator transcription factor [Elusimicrobiota bacterium]